MRCPDESSSDDLEQRPLTGNLAGMSASRKLVAGSVVIFAAILVLAVTFNPLAKDELHGLMTGGKPLIGLMEKKETKWKPTIWKDWSEYKTDYPNELQHLYRSPWANEVEAYKKQQPIEPRWPDRKSKDEILSSSVIIPDHVAGKKVKTPLVGVCEEKAPAADLKADKRNKSGSGGGRRGILVMRKPPEGATYFISHAEAKDAMKNAPQGDKDNFKLHNEAFFVNHIRPEYIIGFIEASHVGVPNDAKEGSKQKRGGNSEQEKLDKLKDAKLMEIGSKANSEEEAMKIINRSPPRVKAAMHALGQKAFMEAIKANRKKKLSDDEIPKVWAHLVKAVSS